MDDSQYKLSLADEEAEEVLTCGEINDSTTLAMNTVTNRGFDRQKESHLQRLL